MTQFERVFDLYDGQIVKAIIYEPHCVDESDGDWACEYQIEGIGSGKTRKSYGVDGIQAFWLALTYVSTTLYFSEEFKTGKLTWLGKRELGLPIADSARYEIEQMK